MTKNNLDLILYSLIGSESLVAAWWERYNHAFGMSPKRKYEKDPDSVVAYIMKYASK